MTASIGEKRQKTHTRPTGRDCLGKGHVFPYISLTHGRLPMHRTKKVGSRQLGRPVLVSHALWHPRGASAAPPARAQPGCPLVLGYWPDTWHWWPFTSLKYRDGSLNWLWPYFKRGKPGNTSCFNAVDTPNFKCPGLSLHLLFTLYFTYDDFSLQSNISGKDVLIYSVLLSYP